LVIEKKLHLSMAHDILKILKLFKSFSFHLDMILRKTWLEDFYTFIHFYFRLILYR